MREVADVLPVAQSAALPLVPPSVPISSHQFVFCSGVFFFKPLARMCVHANTPLKGALCTHVCARLCVCPRVAPLTFAHSDPFICGLAPR